MYILIFMFTFTGLTPHYGSDQGASGGSSNILKFETEAACQFTANKYLTRPLSLDHLHNPRVKRYAECFKLPEEVN